MFRCYLCDKQRSTVAQLRGHLRSHHNLGELRLPVKCCQWSCRSSFTKISSFIRHLSKFHAKDEEILVADDVVDDDVTSNTTHTNSYAIHHVNTSVNSIKNHDMLEDVQSEGTALIASLRAKGNVPYNVITGIVSSFNDMSSSIVSYLESAAINSAISAGVDAKAVECIRNSLQQQAEVCKQPLNFLSSSYKQDKFFDEHPLAVVPETVDFGPRYETVEGHTKVVYDSFQYVSIENTLRTLLQNEHYVQALLDDKYKPDVLSDFADGRTCKSHYLFSDTSKFSIIIQLFYDGMGTANPLRGQSVMSNVGVFYYVIKNLPSVYNSCYANVHLLALSYSADLKMYGFDPVVEKFIAEIKRLSTVGFSGAFPLIGTRQIYVSLGQVACDNLALNSLFGFIESFSVDYFCTMCICTQDEIQHKFYENKFKKRTIQEYDEDLANLTLNTDTGKVHSRGIKKKCPLNSIEGFHVTTNYGLDPMHILLEGVVPLELGCILYTLCCTKKLFTVPLLNSRIHWFWSVVNTDKHCKPPVLNIPEAGKRIKPSMKAVQCWALLKYLPLLVGDLVPDDDPHWLFLLDLCHLVDMVFAP